MSISNNTTNTPRLVADGQLIIGRSSGLPLAATLTAGNNVTITNGSGSITIDASSPGSITWVSVAGTAQTIVNNTGYMNSNTALTTFTLPASAAFGTEFAIVGKGTAGWTIAQGSGQSLVVGSVSSTIGSGGSVSSTNANDAVEFLCTTANTTWTMRSSVGNLTVV